MEHINFYPLILLGISVVTLFVLILWLRLNAFLGLIIAALLVGLLSPQVHRRLDKPSVQAHVGQIGRILTSTPVAPLNGLPAMEEKAPPPPSFDLQLLAAITAVATGFGSTMGKIGIQIALATIIGAALMESGAADRIVRAFTRLFGEKRASLALLFSGFVLSIPVFFDTVFFLLVPLARALYARTKKNYVFYLMAIGAGGAITHSLVPPTPGPIAMAVNLDVKLGMVILMGVAVGLPLSIVGYLYGMWIDRVAPVPMRQVGEVTTEDLEREALRPDSELPSLFWSLCPIVLPVLMITSSTIFDAITPKADNPGFYLAGMFASTRGLLEFVGNPSVALLLATFIAMWVVIRQKHMSREQTSTFTTSALGEAAMILLITSAGGAFGYILKEAQIGFTLRDLGQEFSISPLVLAWSIAVLFKLAQGSGTVSMLTTSAIMATIIAGAPLEYHPVYLIMAIGCGSLVGSWMNDSGFWVVGKLGGLTEAETLRSWTVTLIIMGVAGLPLVWGLSKLLPLV